MTRTTFREYKDVLVKLGCRSAVENIEQKLINLEPVVRDILLVKIEKDNSAEFKEALRIELMKP